MFFKLIFILSLCFYGYFTREITDLLAKYECRNNRNCMSGVSEDEDGDIFYRQSVFENPLYLVLILLFGILFTLLVLGCIKGVIGVCCSRLVGEAGLHLLIDLPRKIDRYQEDDIKHRCIIYDVGGWPVHPDTKSRTVRVIPKKTEFWLNLIFFLAYPLALLVHMCSVCLCIKTYEDETNETVCLQKKGKKGKVDFYRDEDIKEDQDTKYVINMMKKSQLSLNGNKNCAN